MFGGCIPSLVNKDVNIEQDGCVININVRSSDNKDSV